MRLAEYPSVDYIRQALRYEDGKLFWLPRPASHFSDDGYQRRFNTRWAGKEAGTPAESKLVPGRFTWRVNIAGVWICRHVIVWALHRDEWRLGIDHKDRDSQNDRIENLRPADQSQNAANCGPRKTNRSGYKGVSWHAGGRKWQATIQVRGKSIGLGLFSDPAEAHAAYVKAAIEHFGEFACPG